MIRLRDRSDLIDLVAHAPCCCPTARRACVTGKVEVLGGFSELIGDRAGWLVRVIAKHGTTFLVAIIPNEVTHLYDAMLYLHIPWERWIGHQGQEEYSIYNGDRPLKYAGRRLHAQATQPVPDPAR